MISFLLGMGIVLWSGMAFSESEKVLLDERDIVAESLKPSSLRSGLEARWAQSHLAGSQAAEAFGIHFNAQASYGDTRRQGVVPFIPVFGPQSKVQIGVNKRLPYGVELGVGAFHERFSTTNDQIEDAVTNGLRASLAIDLWKDLWGQMSRAQLRSLEASARAIEIRGEVEERQLELAARKIYWSLVASRESLAASEKMRVAAELQLKEVKSRRRSAVATDAEVARYEAQLSLRTATIRALGYQQRVFLRDLKSLLPSLNNKVVDIYADDLGATITKVLQCSTLIQAQQGVPWEYTKFDELISVLEKAESKLSQVNDSYDDANLRLSSSLDYAGVGIGQEAAGEQLTDDGRFGYNLMLSLDVPLSAGIAKSASLKRAIDKKQSLAQIQDLRSKVLARHEEMGPMIAMLQAAVASRRASSGMLEKAISETQKMYDQARVSVDVLISDQSSLQANLLETIQAQLMVIHELLDYFAVFTETPCTINQIVKK